MSPEKSVALCHAQKTYKEDKPEATARLADVKKSSVKAAVAADLPKIDGIFANEEEQRTALETFLCE